MDVMWSVDDLAKYLHVSRKTIFNRIWRREELPPFIKTGRTILFREGDVKTWLDSKVQSVEQPAPKRRGRPRMARGLRVG